VLEVGDVGRIACGLVGIAEIDDRRSGHHQGVAANTAVDGASAAAIGDGVVAVTCSDHIRAAAAVDDVVAGAGRNGVRSRGTGNGQSRAEGRGVYVLEI